MFELDLGYSFLLILCLVAACGFEFVNGFHDTANAVATVIYTNSLKPWTAVIYSGILNFTGVMIGGVGVAIGMMDEAEAHKTMEYLLKTENLDEEINPPTS